MEIALVDGIRSLPTPRAAGNCQICGRPAIAKCGEHVAWHWAHAGRRVCDPWWENEGPWHRAWKECFPLECREIIAHDPNGEKHIADLKLRSGLVIELQHSQMPPDELRSREQFYGNMIWIVDAVPFLQNLTVFDPLPDPNLPFVDDLVFAGPHPAWRKNLVCRSGNFDSLMFYRRSEKDPSLGLVELQTGRELSSYFPDAYTGHHLFLWVRPREIWFQATKPTYLDMGNGMLAELMRYGPRQDTIWCAKLLAKEDLIETLLQAS